MQENMLQLNIMLENMFMLFQTQLSWMCSDQILCKFMYQQINIYLVSHCHQKLLLK